MLRRSPLKRSGFKPKHEPAVPREERPMALLTPSSRRGNYGGTTAGAVLKPKAQRNPHLLALAKMKRCLLAVPGVCSKRNETTVACHSNWAEHGKAGARKANDQWTVWGCEDCHRWLDQGRSPAEEKRYVFDLGHANQVWWWRCIVADASQPAADRRAAQWALDQLEART